MQFSLLASLVLSAAATLAPIKIELFENFIAKYDRHYVTEFEKGRRFQIFSQNVDDIHASNAKNRSYTLGITGNADMTFEEFRSSHLTGIQPALTAAKEDRHIFQAPRMFTEPDSIDWVSKGGVTSVKNQGTCGSCWTFSTVGALEGAMFASGRKMVDLSMQYILSCDTGGNACGGGMMDQAFDWVAKHGIPSLKDEPYLCEDASSSECKSMSCNTSSGSSKEAMVLAIGDVVKHNDVDSTEMALEAAVGQQPVSVAIEADSSVFQHYAGGVLTDSACGSNLDHGVLVVGYGVDNGQKYWKVKNSWGTTFGEDGYIRIEKGDAASGGECGIRKMASFPSLKSSTIVV